MMPTRPPRVGTIDQDLNFRGSIRSRVRRPNHHLHGFTKRCRLQISTHTIPQFTIETRLRSRPRWMANEDAAPGLSQVRLSQYLAWGGLADRTRIVSLILTAPAHPRPNTATNAPVTSQALRP